MDYLSRNVTLKITDRGSMGSRRLMDSSFYSGGHAIMFDFHFSCTRRRLVHFYGEARRESAWTFCLKMHQNARDLCISTRLVDVTKQLTNREWGIWNWNNFQLQELLPSVPWLLQELCPCIPLGLSLRSPLGSYRIAVRALDRNISPCLLPMSVHRLTCEWFRLFL